MPDALFGPIPGAESRDLGHVKLDVVRAGHARVKRMIYPPGFHWAVDMKPNVGTEPGSGKSIEDKWAELGAVTYPSVLSPEEVAELRAIGDNFGSMALKGAAPDFVGEPQPDRWAVDDGLAALAGRWGISPARDLRKVS